MHRIFPNFSEFFQTKIHHIFSTDFRLKIPTDLHHMDHMEQHKFWKF